MNRQMFSLCLMLAAAAVCGTSHAAIADDQCAPFKAVATVTAFEIAQSGPDGFTAMIATEGTGTHVGHFTTVAVTEFTVSRRAPWPRWSQSRSTT